MLMYGWILMVGLVMVVVSLVYVKKVKRGVLVDGVDGFRGLRWDLMEVRKDIRKRNYERRWYLGMVKERRCDDDNWVVLERGKGKYELRNKSEWVKWWMKGVEDRMYL